VSSPTDNVQGIGKDGGQDGPRDLIEAGGTVRSELRPVSTYGVTKPDGSKPIPRGHRDGADAREIAALGPGDARFNGAVEIFSASVPAPDRRPPSVNEDLVLGGPDFVVVLDGATAPPGVNSGCRHNVAWLVGQLGGHLVAPLLGKSTASLADILADAINGVRTDHVDTCDLSNPDSPSSTVAMVRVGEREVEHLVLADSPVVLRSPDRRVTAVEDNRIDRLPEYTLAAVRRWRNLPGGFWVASTEPKAAYEAVTGCTPRAEVETVALLTDGASRFVERYGHSWDDLLAVLETEGPGALIDRVRAYEVAADAGTFRGKRHDDATAVLCWI
jgi:Protein phosphatase 2C